MTFGFTVYRDNEFPEVVVVEATSEVEAWLVVLNAERTNGQSSLITRNGALGGDNEAIWLSDSLGW